MVAGKLADEKQELPENKNRDSLWKITADFFQIFCIAEQIFKHTETYFNNIDDQLITKAVLEDTGVLANFSMLKSNVNYADKEVTKNTLEDLIHLCTKTTTFSLVRSKMDAHKLLIHYFRKTKPGHLNISQKIM